MPVIDRLFSVGLIRKAIWRLWYPFLTRRLRGQEVLFLNYAYEEDPPMGIPLQADDEPNRACIQLIIMSRRKCRCGGKRCWK